MDYLSPVNISELQQWDQDTYWWYVVRNRWLDDAVAEAEKRHGALRLVDVGCGPGGVLARMCRRYRFDSVLGLDGDERLLKVARERGLPVQEADFHQEFQLPVKPNLWFCLDMLEHLENDAEVVRRIHAASEPASLLAITVPAHPFLYSGWDRESGHYRRYTRSTLRRILDPRQWRVLKMEHFFSFLVPIAFAKRVMMREEHKVPRVPHWLNRALIGAGMLEYHLPRLPFGTSLYCLAEARKTP